MEAAAKVPKTMPRITWSHELNWAKAIRGETKASSPIEYAAHVDRDDAARRRRRCTRDRGRRSSTTRRRWSSPTRLTRTNISRANIARGGQSDDASEDVSGRRERAGPGVLERMRASRAVDAGPRRDGDASRGQWVSRPRPDGVPRLRKRDGAGSVDDLRQRDHEVARHGRHHDEGPVRELRARARVEDRRMRGTAASSTARRRSTTTSTGAAPSTSCSTTRTPGDGQESAHVGRIGVRVVRRRRAACQAGGRVEHDAHRRAAARTSSTGSTDRRSSSTSCGAPIGRPR